MVADRLIGVGVSPGQAVGPVVRVSDPVPEPAAEPAPEDLEAEAARIQPAAEVVAEQLRRLAAAATGDVRSVLETTALMAVDPSLVREAEQLVRTRSLPAPRAVYEAAGGITAALEAAGGYLAERVRDVEDVRDRVVAELLGIDPPGVPELTGPSVLVARDLAPADTAALDPDLVLALVTEEGGPTSHTAILARSLGIPAVVACRGVLDLGAERLSVDGDTGVVERVPSSVPTRAATRDDQQQWSGEGGTRDGVRVPLLANVGKPEEARSAVEAGAEGVGLFRTEFCYLSAPTEPGVDEQRAAYAQVLRAFAGKRVIVRTLDSGADKPLPFLGTEAEPNPALGVRGIRLSRRLTGVLDRQLEAIAAAAADSGADVSVMAPMVATPEEAAWFAARVRAAGLPRAGVMIEVPAAALLAEEVLAAVDFASLGTNDLAQYLFAADRQLGAVAALNDPWQPGLLRVVELVGRAGAETGRPVGVCGEAAADPLLACVLVGLGVNSLSMNPVALSRVGAMLATVSLDQCQDAAHAARSADDPATARAAARAVLGTVS
ncbi:MAG TPA: phosphoenolpyruvate--protein phosphotransferase [Pseudonocardiaceae bacterium]